MGETMNTIRTIKLSAISALVLVALGALGASGAQAGEFTAGKYPATVIGTNNVIHKITTNIGVMECAPVLHATQAAAAEELTFSLGYGPCTLGAKEVHVDVNECDYRAHAVPIEGERRIEMRRERAFDGVHERRQVLDRRLVQSCLAAG